MRTLRKNQNVLWYADYIDKEMRYDEDGFATGQYELKYTQPKRLRANVSAGSGSVNSRSYGFDYSNDRVLIFRDPNVPLSIASVLWIERKPEDGEHDYIVSHIKRTINSCTVAVKRVDAT